MEWIYRESSGTSGSAMKNVTNWTWCTIYNCWTNHTRTTCKKKGTVAQAAASKKKMV